MFPFTGIIVREAACVSDCKPSSLIYLALRFSLFAWGKKKKEKRKRRKKKKEKRKKKKEKRKKKKEEKRKKKKKKRGEETEECNWHIRKAFWEINTIAMYRTILQ